MIFWPEEKLKLLDDPSIIKIAKKGYNLFLEELKESQEIGKKYPKFFDNETFSYDNVKWIYFYKVFFLCF